MFNNITEVVCQQLEELIEQDGGEDEDKGYITGTNFMNDFATEEFLTKNIRVRPISGVTGKDPDERQSEHVSRNNILGGIGD